MAEKNHSAAAAALIAGSSTLRAGRADVFRQRERTKRKRLIRAIVLVDLLDAYLWWRYSSGRPLHLPTIPESFPWEIYLPGGLLIIAIGLMIALPLMTGRSPHITVYPEQVEVGLTDVTGLNLQVDEVIRTLDVFLGYGTFRDELGGTPRRGILFEGPPGTGKTYLAKAMAKQAGVPFLFISAPSMPSMFQGMTAYRIRSFFKALRKAARKEGGAIGFIEEIDAIAASRDRVSAATPDSLDRSVSHFLGPAESGMVNELLIQMQSFDQPRLRTRMRGKMSAWLNGYLPTNWQFKMLGPEYHNLLLIAATNRADALDPALLRPGRFDRRLYFDLPTQSEREDLIDYFLGRKKHHEQLDDASVRMRIAHECFGYTPVMIEHLFDEALLVSLRDGRREMNFADVMEAKFAEEIGLKQAVTYTDNDRRAVAVHEAGHAVVAHFLGENRRLEVLSIIKRRGSLGLLAHGDEEERFTRSRTEIESGDRDRHRWPRGGGARPGRVRDGACERPDDGHAAGRPDGGVVRDGRLLDLLRRRIARPDRGREPRREGPGRRSRQAERGGHPHGTEGAGARGARGEPRRPFGPGAGAGRARRAHPRRDPGRHPGLDRGPRLTDRIRDPSTDRPPYTRSMSPSTRSVIVAGARTPTGKFRGAFANLQAVELGAQAIRSAVERAGDRRRAGRLHDHGSRPAGRRRPDHLAPGVDRRRPARRTCRRSRSTRCACPGCPRSRWPTR